MIGVLGSDPPRQVRSIPHFRNPGMGYSFLYRDSREMPPEIPNGQLSLPGIHRRVEREGQAFMVALLEDRILPMLDLPVTRLGEQGFISPRGVFAQFGGAVHFISGSLVLPDAIDRSVPHRCNRKSPCPSPGGIG